MIDYYKKHLSHHTEIPENKWSEDISYINKLKFNYLELKKKDTRAAKKMLCQLNKEAKKIDFDLTKRINNKGILPYEFISYFKTGVKKK